MFPFNLHLIFKKVSSKAFLISFLAIFTLIWVGTGHLSTIASVTTTAPNTGIPQVGIPQRAETQELVAKAPVPAKTQPSPVPSAIELPEVTAPESFTADTSLLFQNERYVVRVFHEGEQAYANVYDKASQTQPLDRVPVAITPAKNPKQDPIKYVAVSGDEQYIVTISPRGTSELTLLKGGTVAYRQTSNRVEIARQVPGVSEPAQPASPTHDLVKRIFINYAKVTLFALMLSMGLHWRFEDVIWLWRQPPLLLRSLFSVLIAVPIFGILALWIPGLTVVDRIGIGAMVICPGAPMIPFKSLKAGAHEKFVGSLQFAVCLLAIFSVPITIAILAQFYPNQAWLSPQTIASQIFFAQVLPMGLGVVIAQYWPKATEELLDPISKVASFMLVLLLVVLLVVTLDDVIKAGFAAYLAMIFLSVASLACGHLLGGSQADTRLALAYATVTRNGGLAILLVTLNFPELDYVKGGIINTLVAYALVAAILSVPYTNWLKRSTVIQEHEPEREVV